jgi:hypothetical protein
MRGKFEAPPARRSRAGLFSLFYLVEIRHRQLPLIANAHPLMGASMRVRLHCDYGNDVLLIPQCRDHRDTLDRAAADDAAAHAVFRTKSKARSEPLWIGCQKLVVRAANSS